ncbi:polysaccharide deacetylase family protein [Metabacillus fastidiosus]|uniref:Polysaccharide deacetylase family protein n=1 Tax=Metabacillus fastidiosus TaxID=1458 RepID=A0ABU6NVU8_9BACI|nr:polysaccharide deacetylase family protein [Metabacillus fastidiosus]MED4400374.1 polysaccharide deacetylase family protein [Metabacillus fastidiosus]MED4464258.1 polysaccharide deacetylase family protein [Metabacillus fastidiosus]
MLKHVKGKIVYITLILVGVFLIYFLFHMIFSYNVAHTNSSESKQKIKSKVVEKSKYEGVGVATSIEEEKTFRSAIHYPVFESDMINSEITSYLNETKERFKKSLEVGNKQLSSEQPANLSLSFRIHKVANGLYSIVFSEESYREETDVKLTSKIFIIDINKEKFVNPDELFYDNDTQREDLYRVVRESLVESKYKYSFLERKWQDWVNKQDLSNMYITKESLVFRFNKYELVIDNAGTLEISVPLQKVAELLKEEWEEKLLVKEKEEEAELVKDNNIISEEEKKPVIEEKDSKKRVALTFDDGPHPKNTMEVLNLLKSYNAKGTFFVLGSRVDFYPDITKRIVEEGHEIGNHTWDHRDLTKLRPETIKQEIEDTNTMVEKATGIKPALFRPPYGATNKAVTDLLNIPEIMWSVDTLDWKYRDPENILDIVKQNTKDGSIILMHDIHSTSVQGLKLVLEYLDKEGYEFVTVTDLGK